MFTHSKQMLTAHRLTQQSSSWSADSLMSSGDTQPSTKKLYSEGKTQENQTRLVRMAFQLVGGGGGMFPGPSEGSGGLSIGGMGVGGCTPGFEG